MAGKKKRDAAGAESSRVASEQWNEIDPAVYRELWLDATRTIFERAFNLALTVEGATLLANPRTLCVWSEFAVSGDLRGTIALGVPADSRELPQEFAPFLAADGAASWQEMADQIGDRWCDALEERLGLRCRLEQDSGPGQRQANPSQENFFALMRSGSWALPVCMGFDVRTVPASESATAQRPAKRTQSASNVSFAGQEQNLDLLLDIELQASLRFGSREMALHEVLDLNTGDVVALDRTIHAPVDLVVGDRIVARGQVVLVNGNYGLRVTEVAEPRKRLESIRCLF
jgi:flagellar motor switch protein FliN